MVGVYVAGGDLKGESLKGSGAAELQRYERAQHDCASAYPPLGDSITIPRNSGDCCRLKYAPCTVVHMEMHLVPGSSSCA